MMSKHHIKTSLEMHDMDVWQGVSLLRRMDVEKLYINIRAIARIVFIFINNLYCIPVHFVWLTIFSPLKLFAEEMYWHLEGILFRWLLCMVTLWSYMLGYHIVECGDDVTELMKERAVIMYNHQSMSDVPLIMASFNSRRGLTNSVMWIMDVLFKCTNFGAVAWAHGDFFIRGGKEHRDSSLQELGCHMKSFYLPRGRKWIVLFPEGGFLKNRKPISQKFAAKCNLPLLENVSLPRAGALKVMLDSAAAPAHDDKYDGIKYVIDVTIAYAGGRPLDLWTIAGGWRPPCDTIFHYRLYKIEEVPKEDEALTQWLYQRYFEKEVMLQTYYDTGSFPENQPKGVRQMPPTRIFHDPLEFVLRHIFFLVSTWVSCNVMLCILSLFVIFLW